MKTTDLAFEVGQRVLIAEPELRGIVEAVLFDKDGVSYKVAYWSNEIRQSAWCLAVELRGAS